MEKRRNIRKIIPYGIIITYLTFLYEYDYFRSGYSVEMSWGLAIIFAGIFGGFITAITSIIYMYSPRKKLFGKISIYVGLALLIFVYLAIFGLFLFSSRILIIPNLFTLIFGGLYFAILFLFIGNIYMLKLKVDKINFSLIIFSTGLIILIPSILFITYSLSLAQFLPIKDENPFLNYMFIGVGIILTIIGGYLTYSNQIIERKTQSP